MAPHILVWVIAALATAGVILRPFNLPEAIWAVSGAVLLVVLGLLPVSDAIVGVRKGADVYLFLIGMMTLAELARKEGLFEWLARLAVRHARGSGARLFWLIYVVGIIVTVFLSNDATAVVLTPAVYAAARAADAEPLPYLLICAFIANAASFVLPISNPANLVIYGSQMPPLPVWLATFGPASIVAIALTFVSLRLVLRSSLPARINTDIAAVRLSRGGRLAATGIGATAVILLVASALGWDLGLPTFIAGLLTAGFILLGSRQSPWPVARDISWGVLPLVAGLFVLVEALQTTGVIDMLATTTQRFAAQSVGWTAAGAGIIVAIACNLLNNLPAGLIAGSTVAAGQLPAPITNAVLVGVDLGPNLSVTGSLATILWLVALRREGQRVGVWRFLKIGAVVMPPALIGALLALHIAAN